MNNCSASAEKYGNLDIPDAEIYFNATFLSVVMVTTVVGNALALHAFIISAELKQITYYFIASLCVSDLLIAFFSISLWIVDVVNRWGLGCNWRLPPELQDTYQCVDIFGGTWSIMSLAFISVERYICIKHALHYAHIMTTKRVYISFVFLFLYCIAVTVLQKEVKEEKGPNHLVKQLVIFFMAYLLPVFIKVFSYSKIYHEAKRQQAQIQQLHRYAQTLTNSNAETNKSLDSLPGDSMKTGSTNVDSCHSRPDSTSNGADVKRRRFKPSETEDDSSDQEKISCVRFFSCYEARHLDDTESTCLDCDECERSGEERLANVEEYVMKLNRSLSYRSNKTTRTHTITSFSKTENHELEDLADHSKGDHCIETINNKGISFASQTEAELFRNDHTHTSSCIEDKLVGKLQFAATEDGSIEQKPRRTFSMGDGYRERISDNLSPLSALEECQSKQRCSEGSNLSPISAFNVHTKHRHSEGSHTYMMKKLRSFSKWSPAASPLINRKCSKKKASEQKRHEHKIRRFKKELRAAKVVALIMGTFLICWTPFNVLIMCYAFHVEASMRSILICKLLHYTNSAINPILYVVLNKVYRSAVVKVIKKFKIFSNNW